MANAFFTDLISTISERGRTLLGRGKPADGKEDAAGLIELCEALLSGRGEASGTAMASEVLDSYHDLDATERRTFFHALARNFAPDRDKVNKAIEAWMAEPGDGNGGALHFASEPRRQELIRRLNRAPGGTGALVEMRADLLSLLNGHKDLAALDRDIVHLLGSWFNRGFLVLRRIDWSTPANILEQIIRYEAVHEIRDWDDLRRRIDPADRRCYAFFHPALVDEPLIFVEVALTAAAPDAIAPLLAERRAQIAADKARVAAFYSISNCQQGLSSVSFGNFLIKQVVEELRRDLPRIESFVTLSPMPGFRTWVETTGDPAVEALAADARRLAKDESWAANPESAARARKALEPLAAYYLLKARRPDGRVIDSVARFHLGNGARLERINWMGDMSVKGMFESYGLMVNYLYDLNEIERNHEAFANQGTVVASSAVKKLLPSARTLTLTPALPAPEA